MRFYPRHRQPKRRRHGLPDKTWRSRTDLCRRPCRSLLPEDHLYQSNTTSRPLSWRRYGRLWRVCERENALEMSTLIIGNKGRVFEPFCKTIKPHSLSSLNWMGSGPTAASCQPNPPNVIVSRLNNREKLWWSRCESWSRPFMSSFEVCQGLDVSDETSSKTTLRQLMVVASFLGCPASTGLVCVSLSYNVCPTCSIIFP